MSIFAICLATLSLAPAEVVLEPGHVEVVVPRAARESRSATCFAAEEMTNFLSRVLGSPVPVVLRPSETRTAIVLGTNEWSASAGIDIFALPRDAARIRTAPNRVYIAGFDEGGFDIRRGKRAYFLQHGTLNGVYAVLERFAGCRFYFPGELGEIVPRADRIVIPATDFTDRPDYTVRSSTRSLGQWPEEYPASAKTETEARFFLRLRLSTERISCCHGQCRSGFAKRFGKTHPEYFRVKEDGTRHIGDPEVQEDCDNWKNSSVCNSSAIWDEIYRDAKSYLSGEGPEVRGMRVQNGKDGFRWGSQAVGGKYYDVMPNDGMHKCFCALCQAEYAKARDASDYADDFIWRKVAEVGNRLKADGVKGTVTMMAYRPYVGVPNVDIPDNVAVMVCNNGPWLRAGAAEAALANVRAWTVKRRGKVWLWHNTGRYSTLAQNATDVPSPTPRTFGRHYRDLAPWIFGAYCSNNSQRFLYSAINYYVFYRVAWDNRIDADGLVDEYVRLMFGAAAKPMGEFFDLLEETWMEKVVANVEETPVGTMVVPPSEYAFWAKIYDLRFLDRLAAFLDAAEKAVAPGSLEARRVALFRREYLEPMYPHARAYDAEGVAKEKARRAADPRPSLVEGFDGPVTIDVTGAMTNKLFHGTSFKVDLEPGKTYRLSYFIRGTDIVYNHRWGCAGATVWSNRGADWTLAILGGGLCGTFDWIHQEKVFTVPEAEGEGRFRTMVSLRLGRATGKAEFDGLVVEEEEEGR